MEKSIFDHAMTRQEYFDRYDNKKSNHNAHCAMNTYDYYRKMKFNGISEEEYQSQLTKLDDVALYRELDRLVQFMTKEGNQTTANSLKKLHEKLDNEADEYKRRKYEIKAESLQKRKGLSVATARNYFNFILSWLRLNGIKIDQHLLKEFVKFPKQRKEKKKPIPDEVVEQIANEMKPKYRGYWELLNVAGMRPDREALNLLIRDFDFSVDPVKITIKAEFAKNGEERVTFCTKKIGDKIRQFNIKDRLPNEKAFEFAYTAFYAHFSRIRTRLGLSQKYQNGFNFLINPYKARKRARTKLGAKDKDFGEILIGHSDISNLYVERTDEELGQMYKENEMNISISKADKYKMKATTLEQELEKRKSMELKMQKMEDEMKRMQDMINNNTKI